MCLAFAIKPTCEGRKRSLPVFISTPVRNGALRGEIQRISGIPVEGAGRKVPLGVGIPITLTLKGKMPF